MSKLNLSEDLKLPLEAVTQTFAILAKRGVGKTYTGAVLVEEMLRAAQQVVVVDPVGVWWGLRSSADGKSAGFSIVVFGGEHADVPLDENAGEVIAGAIVEHGFSAILDLSLLRKAAQVRFMTAFAEALYRLNRRPLHLAVDEADAFAPQRPLPGEQRLLGAFEDIVRRGRARGLGVTLITQRAAVLNKNVLTQIEVLVVLRTISPQDREAIESWTEIHGTPQQLDQLSESLASLPIGNAWFWSPGWLDVFKRVQVRRRITYDSSSTPKVGEKVVTPKEIAAVDLNQLGEQIKQTAARAKENDPAELKRTITQLRKQLAAETAKREPAGVTEKLLAAEDFKRFEASSRVIEKHAELLAAKLAKAAEDLSVLESHQRLLRESLEKFQGRPLTSAPRFISTFRPQPPAAKRMPEGANTRIAPAGNGESISGGLKRMMIALRQRPGLTKRQLGVRAGLSSTSGTFGTYLGRLRSYKWVHQTGDEIFLTESGAVAMGDDFTPLPEGRELLNYWLGELGSGGAGRMLRVLADVYPQALTKEELGERAGISATSGTFGTYLGKLRTLELVEGRGELRAAEEFFV
jgi:hypothetical protein